jgi:amino acid transporter
MAVAATGSAKPNETQLLKALNWYDGFVIALCNPGFLIGFLGYSIGALGGWGAVVLWTISVLIAGASNRFYAEMASMFPDKPGGLALYAYEAWRKYFSMVGPIATFGYWFAWSTVLSIFGIVVGSLIATEWFSSVTFSYHVGLTDINLAKIIAAVVIFCVWLVNVFGIKPAVWVGYVIGAMLMVPLAVFIIGPFVTGNWHGHLLTWGVGGAGITFTTAMVWLYLMGWSAYGTEACAVFTPEYKNASSATRALRSSAFFSLAVFALLPLGISGIYNVPKWAIDDPVAFYVPAFHEIMGAGAGVAIIFLCASLVLSMNSATADGSRALYGIARDHMTIKWLNHLNRFHVPARAMLVDMVLNLALLFLLGSPLAILVCGNLGYILAHFFALSGFLLLRKDRPKWPRPYRAPRSWVPLAGVLAGLNLLFIIYGVTNPNLTGYGTTKDLLIGFGVLLLSVLLYIYRRAVQDHLPIHWREETPTMPTAEQQAALESEMAPASE